MRRKRLTSKTCTGVFRACSNIGVAHRHEDSLGVTSCRSTTLDRTATQLPLPPQLRTCSGGSDRITLSARSGHDVTDKRDPAPARSTCPRRLVPTSPSIPKASNAAAALPCRHACPGPHQADYRTRYAQARHCTSFRCRAVTVYFGEALAIARRIVGGTIGATRTCSATPSDL